MEWTLATNVVFLSCLYLSLFTSSALGKCGKYRHACYGGNGKRSDPSFNLSPPSSSAEASINLKHPSLLSKILLSDDDRLSEKELATATAGEETWPGSMQTYFSSIGPEAFEEGSSLAGDQGAEATTRSKSCRAELQLALVEIMELRKYVAVLEGMVRVSSPDLD